MGDQLAPSHVMVANAAAVNRYPVSHVYLTAVPPAAAVVFFAARSTVGLGSQIPSENPTGAWLQSVRDMRAGTPFLGPHKFIASAPDLPQCRNSRGNAKVGVGAPRVPNGAGADAWQRF